MSTEVEALQAEVRHLRRALELTRPHIPEDQADVLEEIDMALYGDHI